MMNEHGKVAPRRRAKLLVVSEVLFGRFAPLNFATKAMTNLAERGSLASESIGRPFSCSYQDAVFGGQIRPGPAALSSPSL
jgi:hypothetical protein